MRTPSLHCCLLHLQKQVVLQWRIWCVQSVDDEDPRDPLEASEPAVRTPHTPELQLFALWISR